MGMKLLILAALLGLCSPTLGRASSDWLRPEILNLVPEKVYVPNSIESNKEVEILIAGKFMNSCFRAGPVTAEVDYDRKIIYVNNQVYFYESSWCLQVIKKYMHTINLGTLSPGQYEIRTWDNQGQEHLLGGVSVFLTSQTQ